MLEGGMVLHRLPATLADCERMWSQYKFIWSDLRNRLNEEDTREMLMILYWNFHRERNEQINK